MTDPAPPPQTPVRLDQAATHVEVSPGGEVILRGSYSSVRDGSVIDASTTTWPAGAPGGASVDTGGLFDLEAGGLHVVSRDPVKHEVHAVATGEAASACAASGVASPCLPIRLLPQARSRLLTVSDWSSSLKGGILIEVPVPPAYAPAMNAAAENAPILKGAGLLLAASLVGIALWKAQKRRASSPRAQLLAFARSVREKASHADPVVAAPLTPALETALASLKSGRVDASSAEGKRVRVVLERVDQRLDESRKNLRASEEQDAADQLVREVEIALEAADETLALDHKRARPSPPRGALSRQRCS